MPCFSPFGRRGKSHRLALANLRQPWLVVLLSFGPQSFGPQVVTGDAVAATPDSVDFFETKIRPVLVKHCYECHSGDSEGISGSLWLDSAEGMRTGGDSGPAVEPGDIDGSLLIAAIRYESTEMPPDGRLPDSVIRDFEQWVAAGAVDPRGGTSATPRGEADGIDMESGREFWAFRPIRESPPEIASSPSGGHAIDAYLESARRRAGVSAIGPADPATRLRRLSFDLTGLPPNDAVQSRWLADPSPATWRRIVDEMLASPGFAEHWARHWMDVARYADSNGSDFNATFHDAWRYRDYLIRSFASDRPWDAMIRQQIAGDLLPAEDDHERRDNLVATTFLMLGTKMLSERNKDQLRMDVVDEQVDTVGRAFMGLTLGCARCHDHKFDPIPTEDYYALAGIFRSTRTLHGESQKYVSTWDRTPLPVEPERAAAVERHEAELNSTREAIKSAEGAVERAKSERDAKLAGVVADDDAAEQEGEWTSSTYSKSFIGDGYLHDNNGSKGKISLRYSVTLPEPGEYEVRLSHSPGANRASNVPVTIATADGETRVTWDQREATEPPMWTSLGSFRFDDPDTFVVIRNDDTDGYVIADAVQFVPAESKESNDSSKETVSDVGEDGSDETAESRRAEVARSIERAEEKLKGLRSELKRLEADAPPPLPQAMAVADRPTPEIGDSPVHIRGEIRNLGDNVPRGFLRVCGEGDATIGDSEGSGRIELAEWLTDPDHPLVARVLVNRVWMHLLGEGIVRTVDNFGYQGERPSHPELLDAMAIRFVRGGWRLKPLVREIVLSEAYQLSSRFDPAAAEADPENRSFWRMNRKRLPAESIRDAMVSAAGGLDRRPQFDRMRGFGTLVSGNSGGDRADVNDVGAPCRSVYLPVVRGYLPPMMVALDMADPDLLVGRRPTTNVPGQALVLVNSPDINRWAEAAGSRVFDASDSFEGRLRKAYRLVLQRSPDAMDRRIAKGFLGDRVDSPDAWREFVAAMFAGTEFRWLD